MSIQSLNKALLDVFPEIRPTFEEYVSWQDGMDTGCFLTCEDVLLPLVIEKFENGLDVSFIDRASSFIEGLVTSDDDYEVNVGTVALLEGLKASLPVESVRPRLRERSRTIFDSLGA